MSERCKKRCTIRSIPTGANCVSSSRLAYHCLMPPTRSVLRRFEATGVVEETARRPDTPQRAARLSKAHLWVRRGTCHHETHCSGQYERDRKSTRLNSSHLGISYA